MKVIKILFWVCWRSWFYILTFIVTSSLSPLLILFLLKEAWYPYFYAIARNLWAKPILYGMFLFPKYVKQSKIDAKNYILIANHTSMMDIMLMFYVSKQPFVFVGKKELSKLPIFGYFYKRAAILVDRSSAESRKSVYKEAKKRLEKGLSICIFPEGGVPDDTSVVLADFKDGAFGLAIEHQIPLLPVLFLDCKKRFPYRFLGGKMGEMRILVYPLIESTGLKQENRRYFKEKTHTFLKNELLKHNYN